MKTCFTCRHWVSNRFTDWVQQINHVTPGFFDYGMCRGMTVVQSEKIVYDSPVLIDPGGQGCLIETRKDFSCNLWRAK